MVKRVKNYFGFDWGYIAGKSDKGETAHETASREMWEEIGIRQYPQHIHSLSEYGIKSPPDPFTIFITSIPKEIPLTIKVDEIKEAKWFPIHNLPESRPMSEDAVIQSIISVVKSILLLPYRQNVQFWCYRKDGKILLLDESTTDEVYWKFPQGGIESNETHEKAITRELEEELNIKTFQILSKAKYINRYNWPPTLLVKGFRGQEQHIYLVYLPHPKEVKPNK
ncbi:MAG: NUDIX domain-containing protein, partial [archaeon]|nr:NUDIX domain-containing protein [archaeon]